MRLTPEELLLAQADWGEQSPTVPAPGYFPEDPEEWLRRHVRFCQEAARGEAEIVLLGDSITEAWSSPEVLPLARETFGSRFANFGIGGDRTQQLLWRIDRGTLDGLRPRLVVLKAGVNNLWPLKHSAAEVAEGVQAVVERVRTKLPHAEILLQGILPTGETVDSPYRSLILGINTILSQTEGVHFVDFGALFLEPDGSISSAIMPDFCHLSVTGYQRWSDALRPLVQAP